MRYAIGIIVLVLLVAVLAPVAAAEPAATQPTKMSTANMTVAELVANGDSARRTKDYDSALEFYRAALKKDRKNAVLLNKVGLVELQMGRFQAAQMDFEQAIKRDKKYPQAWNNLGVALYAQKMYDSAVKNYKKALALHETDAVFHTNLGGAWFSMKQMDRAMAEYARALELDPDVLVRIGQTGIAAQISGPEERARYSYVLAKLYAKRGDLERALDSLKRAKEDGYNISGVYQDAEFAALRQDPRLIQLAPPPAGSGK